MALAGQSKPSALSTAYPRSRSPGSEKAAVGRRWSTRAVIPPPRASCPKVGRMVPFPRSDTPCGLTTLPPTAPRLLGDRRRGRNVDNPTKCSTTSRQPVGVETERVVHGLSTVAVPRVATAAVGRRWATRATKPRVPILSKALLFSSVKRLDRGCPPPCPPRLLWPGTVAVDKTWTTRRTRCHGRDGTGLVAASIRPAPRPDR